ncbi:MAG: transposase [Nocardioidaceae bacterium]
MLRPWHLSGSSLVSLSCPRWSRATGVTSPSPPVVAARTLADVGDIARFADRNRFASWTGTAPLDASSGEQHFRPGTGAPEGATWLVAAKRNPSKSEGEVG